MKRQSRALKMAALEEEMAREAGTGLSLRRSSVSGVQGSEGIELGATTGGTITKDVALTRRVRGEHRKGISQLERWTNHQTGHGTRHCTACIFFTRHEILEYSSPVQGTRSRSVTMTRGICE